ncbi:TIM barrel protein [bacterium]|nr:TIM barrel protein [bacterium]
MSSVLNSRFDRRRFLGTCAAAGAATLLNSTGLQAADPYAGFKMGIQSYSLRGFDAETALQHTKTLGLKFWEAYPKHVPMGTLPEHIAKEKKMLDDAGVTLAAYGVLGFDANETKAREAFDFAKAMGIKSLSANPKKDKATFDLLDKLCDEYQVAIAIHNHGPGALYDRISDAEAMIKDRHPLVGCCVDTGHYLRSDEDPVEAIERFGKRTFGVHFKDVLTIEKDGKRQKQFRILGEGDLNVLGCLKALRKLDYQYCVALEYEENPSNPLSDIEVCLQTVRDAAAKL